MQKEELMTVNELASVLRLHPCTVYRMLRREALPHLRVARRSIRFNRQEVEEYLRRKAAEK